MCESVCFTPTLSSVAPCHTTACLCYWLMEGYGSHSATGHCVRHQPWMKTHTLSDPQTVYTESPRWWMSVFQKLEAPSGLSICGVEMKLPNHHCSSGSDDQWAADQWRNTVPENRQTLRQIHAERTRHSSTPHMQFPKKLREKAPAAHSWKLKCQPKRFVS